MEHSIRMAWTGHTALGVDGVARRVATEDTPSIGRQIIRIASYCEIVYINRLKLHNNFLFMFSLSLGHIEVSVFFYTVSTFIHHASDNITLSATAYCIHAARLL